MVIRTKSLPVRLPLLQDSALFALPVALLLGAPLVVLFLALGQRDLDLHLAATPVHGRWNQGVALALDLADQAREFVLVEQKSAGAHRVAVDVRGRGGQWIDHG